MGGGRHSSVGVPPSSQLHAMIERIAWDHRAAWGEDVGLEATATSEPGALGELLRRHRVAAGLTQERLAEAAGLSARGIADLERGVRRFPYADTLSRLAKAMRLTEHEHSILQATARRTVADRSSHMLAGPPHHLPSELTSFVGREQEVAELQYRLS